jgi:hypothetical protein
MSELSHTQVLRRARGLNDLSRLALLLAGTMLVLVLAPASSKADVSTFGSPLAVPATLNTADNLNYEGSGVSVLAAIFHIPHDGADTALWNVALAGAAPAAPAGGQILSVRLEGCAQQPEGAPPPLTQIHFQDLVSQPGGGVKANLTSQAFDIPVCGAGGATGSTVTTYLPTNFCVSQGDYVSFTDEGGFVPRETGMPPYPAGVPYMVIGSVESSTMDSFIRNGGTNNGDTFSPGDRTYHDGFATNRGEELMLQATLGTGPDAISWCPGGAKLISAPSSRPKVQLPPLRVGRQTDGINHRGIASIAMFCRLANGCSGIMTLAVGGNARQAKKVQTSFKILGGKTIHVPVRVPKEIVKLARRRRSGVPMRLSAVVEGKTISQTVVLRIF